MGLTQEIEKWKGLKRAKRDRSVKRGNQRLGRRETKVRGTEGGLKGD